MASKNKTLAWAVGLGTVAAAGLAIWYYESKTAKPASGSTPSTTATSAPPATTSASAGTLTPNMGETLSAYNTRAAAAGQLGVPAGYGSTSYANYTWNGTAFVP